MWSVCILLVLGIQACSPKEGEFRGLDRTDRVISDAKQPVSPPPPAVIGNEPLSWDEIRPRLAEASGGVVVEEVILDHQLKAELDRLGLKVTDAEIARERELLVQSLERGAGVGPEQSAQLITRLQQSRGLGPVRYRALLERNAMLRRVVRDGVEINQDAVTAELKVRFGPRVRCRIIVVTTEPDARRLLARLKAEEGDLTERFAAEAKLVSVDPSASKGGQVDPISPDDPSYATAVREVVRGLAEGQLSPILVLDNGYAVVLGEGHLSPVDPPATARVEIEQELRLRAERIAMDRLAQRLLNAAPVIVFDPALQWSWQLRVLRPGR